MTWARSAGRVSRRGTAVRAAGGDRPLGLGGLVELVLGRVLVVLGVHVVAAALGDPGHDRPDPAEQAAPGGAVLVVGLVGGLLDDSTGSAVRLRLDRRRPRPGAGAGRAGAGVATTGVGRSGSISGSASASGAGVGLDDDHVGAPVRQRGEPVGQLLAVRRDPGRQAHRDGQRGAVHLLVQGGGPAAARRRGRRGRGAGCAARTSAGRRWSRPRRGCTTTRSTASQGSPRHWLPSRIRTPRSSATSSGVRASTRCAR